MHRSTCFTFASDLTALSGVAREEVFAAHTVLIERNLLNNLVESVRFRGLGTSNGVAARLMQRICARSLAFGKLVEQITVDEIVEGKRQLGVAGMADSRRTVERGLSVLVDMGLVVRFSADAGRRVFYGVNLPKVLADIQALFAPVRMTSPVAEKALHEVKRLSGIFQPVAWLYGAIKDVVIKSFYEFKSQLAQAVEKCGGVMSKLSEAVRGAVARADSAKNARRARKAARPYDKDPAAALEEWNRQVEMRADLYPQYLPHATAKDKSMMKALLKELRAKGYDDDKVRELIEAVVDSWSRYREVGFQCADTSYQKSLPRVPDFAFFYRYRRELLNLLLPVSLRDRLDGVVRKKAICFEW